ncbi:5' exonuclease Apollo [Batrachochytrium dendrobatidis]
MGYQPSEYPEIQIDMFQHKHHTVAYLLTHAHADHMVGLVSLLSVNKVYCTPVTAKLLQTTMGASNLFPIVFNKPFHIQLANNKHLQITFLPAHHCPGSAMILIIGDNGTILCTGDFRSEKRIDSLSFAIDRLSIDSVYLDTTFAHPNWMNLPTRLESANALIEVIKTYSESVNVYLQSKTIGYEHLWVCLARHFNTKIYVTASRKIKYELMDQCKKADDEWLHECIVSQFLTTDEQEARFFVDMCPKAELSKTKGCLLNIHPSAMFWGRGSDSDAISHHTYWKRVSGFKDFIVQDLRDSMSWRLLYSMHSSLSELIEFVAVLKPQRVYPTVTSSSNAMFFPKQIMKHFMLLNSTETALQARRLKHKSVTTADLDKSSPRPSEPICLALPCMESQTTVPDLKFGPNLDAIAHVRRSFLDIDNFQSKRLRCTRY